MSDKINLELNNGTIIGVDVSSTVYAITVIGTLSDISIALGAISTDTLKNAILYTTPEGQRLVDKILTGFVGNSADDEYRVIFNLRDKTENEIINERLNEQDAALMELAEMVVG